MTDYALVDGDIEPCTETLEDMLIAEEEIQFCDWLFENRVDDTHTESVTDAAATDIDHLFA